MNSQEQQVLRAPGYAARLRVRVADGDGMLRDLTALDLAGGRDFTRSIKVEFHVDEDFATANFVVRRQVDRWNISPYVATSRLNQDATAGYVPLLATGRLCVVEAFLLPMEMAPGAGDWREVFRGVVGPIRESQDSIQVLALDFAHELADRGHFLEVERKYGSGGGVDVEDVMQQIIEDSYGEPFEASASYLDRDRVHPSTPNGYWYQAENTAAAGAEPSWPTTLGATVMSGSVSFRCMGATLQLYTPVSPTFPISPEYNQRRETCWAALTALNQFGWSLRQKWDSGTSAWRLTLYEPDRAKTTPDFTWYPNTTAAGAAVPSILELPSWETGIEDITNVMEGKFWDGANLDAAGQPTLTAVERRDTTSIDAHGWRWMGLALKTTDQINTSSEMTTLLDNLVSDMKDPFATHEVVLPLFWAVELGDLYRFKANNYIYTSDQDLAVVAYVHEQGEGEGSAPTTRLTCRGKPSAGFARWRRLGFDVSALKPAPQNGPDAPTGVTVTQVQGGLHVSWVRPVAGQDPHDFEVHVSTNSGFTPDDTTVRAVVDGTAKTVSDLTPGITYYVKVVPRDIMGNRGTASSEESTGAGYTAPRAMTPSVVYNDIPKNPSFEALTDPSVPPDGWSVAAGTWATTILNETTAVYSGARAVKFTANNARLRSELFPVRPDAEVQVMANASQANVADQVYVAVEFYDAAQALLSTVSSTFTGITGFFRRVLMAAINPSAAYAAVVVGAGTLTGAGVVVDGVRAVQLLQVDAWHAMSSGIFNSGWGTTALANSVSAAYSKDPVGFVHLRGAASRTSGSNTTIGTLPTGYRPLASEYFRRWDSTANAFVYLEIKANGDMSLGSVNNGVDYELSGITFWAA